MQSQPLMVPLQAIKDSVTQKSGVRLFILRTDLNHPHISGNKWFKLRYNLLEAKKNNKETLLTFGGAFSNHIAATAAAGKEHGFKTIGIIRGEENAVDNPTLKFAKECGMALSFVSRSLYRDKDALLTFVHKQFRDEACCLIPEGGSNELGVIGCKEITGYIPIDFDYVCSACGTGATLAGIILSLRARQKALGFQILKGDGYIKKEIEHWLTANPKHEAYGYSYSDGPSDSLCEWSIREDYHFGGYAKINAELLRFVKDFERENNIPLDLVYTAKMLYGIYDLIKKGFFRKGETIVAVHTGGLQGNAGFDIN